jgi:hypothetical protein
LNLKFTIAVVTALLFFDPAFATTASCVATVAPELKGIDQLKQGSFVEFRFKSEFHDRAMEVEGKYLGYAQGLVVKWLEGEEIRYGTFWPADIIGKPTVMGDLKAKKLQAAMDIVQSRTETEDYEKFRTEKQKSGHPDLKKVSGF